MPGSEFAEPPLAGYPGPDVVHLSTLSSVGRSPLAPGQLASDLPASSRIGPRGGSPPRSRWKKLFRAHGIDASALEILGRWLGTRGA